MSRRIDLISFIRFFFKCGRMRKEEEGRTESIFEVSCQRNRFPHAACIRFMGALWCCVAVLIEEVLCKGGGGKALYVKNANECALALYSLP